MANTKQEFLHLKRAFKAISPKINEELKMKAALDNNCSYYTIKRYLNGEVGKVAFGKALLKYLEEQITIAA